MDVMNRRGLFAFLLIFSACLSPVYGATVRSVPFDSKALPAARSLSHKGKVVSGARWFDSSGENLLLLTQTGAFPSTSADRENRSAELYAYQYIRSAGGWKLLWMLRDFERGCPYDLYAGFLPDSLSVTDLNGDKRAETTFLYKLACRSDVSPARLKLMMHEGKAKFAIRGTTRVQIGPGVYSGGEATVDRQFFQAPATFGKYAQTQWKKFVNETTFDQF